MVRTIVILFVLIGITLIISDSVSNLSEESEESKKERLLKQINRREK